MCLDNRPGDRQAEAGSAVATAQRCVAPAEWLEDVRQNVGCDTGAVVGDADSHLVVVRIEAQGGAAPSSAISSTGSSRGAAIFQTEPLSRGTLVSVVNRLLKGTAA
jgi:hypothetical protein